MEIVSSFTHRKYNLWFDPIFLLSVVFVVILSANVVYGRDINRNKNSGENANSKSINIKRHIRNTSHNNRNDGIFSEERMSENKVDLEDRNKQESDSLDDSENDTPPRLEESSSTVLSLSEKRWQIMEKNVENLARHMTRLKKEQNKDKAQIKLLSILLKTSDERLSNTNSELNTLKQHIRTNRQDTGKLRERIDDVDMQQNVILDNLQNFKISHVRLNQTVSDIVADVTGLAMMGEQLHDSIRVNNQDLSSVQRRIKDSKASFKHLKSEMMVFIHELFEEENGDEDDDEEDEVLSEDINQGAVLPDKAVLQEGSGQFEQEDNSDKNVQQNRNVKRRKNNNHAINNNSNPRWKTFEKKLRRDIRILKDSDLNRDMELSELNNMYLNLSLKLAKLENRMLNVQQDTDSVKLHQMTLNFTAVLAVLEQWQITNPLFLINATQQNQDLINRLGEFILNNTNRIGKIEVKLLDQKVSIEYNKNLCSKKTGAITESLKKLKHRIHSHKHATTEIAGTKEIEIKSTQLDHRVANLEVKMLNASLQTCSKQHQDIYQDLKLHQLDQVTTALQETSHTQRESVTRIERKLYRLHLDIKDNTDTISSLKKQGDKVINYLPELYEMQDEMEKFMDHLPTDCNAIYKRGQRKSGSYIIHPKGSDISVKVYCDIDDHNNGAGWTVIQRRTDGTETFSRLWRDYESGFGSVESDFWLGNEFIHLLTHQANYSLHIEMFDTYGEKWIATYGLFRMGDEGSNYALHVEAYEGNATDSLSDANGMAFSTEDEDNDASSTHCALYYTAGWWYKHCHYCNLNGRYNVGIVWFNREWNEWIQMTRTKMTIVPSYV